MNAQGFTLFETAIGVAGVVWSGRGVVGVELPQARERQTRARLTRRFPDAVEAPPPPDVRTAIDGMTTLLAGEATDLSGVVLDLQDAPDFERRVYGIARAIPPGETLTYGEIAIRLGEPGAAREVGRALGANPAPIIVPCHRVLGSGGKVGGFSAPGGVATKARMLSIEGARTSPAPMLFENLPISVRDADRS
ncbi:MAG: methylated-DNA--[protein]-cysteine S-methyltransferase [Pseudomonadota bacterium]|nr:methylated-DNA--[protein]-cysteine S-methyltransferase [Pseudomonadota bacterium]